jgi:uncharacterized membrane protein YfcA
MGGGALMTPLLVVVFHVDPLRAVSSDLVASMVMKPIGGSVHLRRGTVNRSLVRWLVVGSVPSAFVGVLLLRALDGTYDIDAIVRRALGVALLVAATSIIVKGLLEARRPEAGATAPITVRPLATVAIGALGGLVVGMTSVGSGSLMIVLLLALYPTLRPAQLVGTDLVQAVPLVAAASAGHLLFGDVRLGLTTSVLLGAIPGVYIGARVSARTTSALVRPALVIVLVASALKLLGVPSGAVVAAAVLLIVAAAGASRREQRYRRDLLVGQLVPPDAGRRPPSPPAFDDPVRGDDQVETHVVGGDGNAARIDDLHLVHRRGKNGVPVEEPGFPGNRELEVAEPAAFPQPRPVRRNGDAPGDDEVDGR